MTSIIKKVRSSCIEGHRCGWEIRPSAVCRSSGEESSSRLSAGVRRDRTDIQSPSIAETNFDAAVHLGFGERKAGALGDGGVCHAAFGTVLELGRQAAAV